MIVGEGSVLIGATPKEILEFVLDLERYRRADTKIGRVHWLKRDGDRGRVKHGGRLRGVPVDRLRASSPLRRGRA